MKMLLKIVFFGICLFFIIYYILPKRTEPPRPSDPKQVSRPTPSPKQSPTPPPWSVCIGSFQETNGGSRILTIRQNSTTELQTKILVNGRKGDVLDIIAKPAILSQTRFRLIGTNSISRSKETLYIVVIGSNPTRLRLSREGVPFPDSIIFKAK